MTPLLRSRWAWVAAVVVALAFAVWWFRDSGVGKGRLAGRTRAILAGATKVEVLRLDGKVEPQPQAEGEVRLGGFPVTARGKDQGREFADKLADILSDDGTYTRRFAKCFWPGVAFRVWKGQESTEVLICFYCDNLYVGPPALVARETASFLGSPARARLIRLAQEAFPDDKDIQGLKAR